MRIKDVLNMILWKYSDSLDQFLLVILDRASNSGFRYIEFTYVKRVDKNYLYIDIGSEDVVVIPLHRVVRIEKKNGEIVWERR